MRNEEPAALTAALTSLRRDLAWAAIGLDDAFHATADTQAVRDKVLPLLAARGLTIDVTLLEKAKAQPHVRADEPMFYQHAWFYHFKTLARRELAPGDELLVIVSQIGRRGSGQLCVARLRAWSANAPGIYPTTSPSGLVQVTLAFRPPTTVCGQLLGSGSAATLARGLSSGTASGASMTFGLRGFTSTTDWTATARNLDRLAARSGRAQGPFRRPRSRFKCTHSSPSPARERVDSEGPDGSVRWLSARVATGVVAYRGSAPQLRQSRMRALAMARWYAVQQRSTASCPTAIRSQTIPECSTTKPPARRPSPARLRPPRVGPSTSLCPSRIAGCDPTTTWHLHRRDPTPADAAAVQHRLGVAQVELAGVRSEVDVGLVDGLAEGDWSARARQVRAAPDRRCSSSTSSPGPPGP